MNNYKKLAESAARALMELDGLNENWNGDSSEERYKAFASSYGGWRAGEGGFQDKIPYPREEFETMLKKYPDPALKQKNRATFLGSHWPADYSHGNPEKSLYRRFYVNGEADNYTEDELEEMFNEWGFSEKEKRIARRYIMLRNDMLRSDWQ